MLLKDFSRAWLLAQMLTLDLALPLDLTISFCNDLQKSHEPFLEYWLHGIGSKIVSNVVRTFSRIWNSAGVFWSMCTYSLTQWTFLESLLCARCDKQQSGCNGVPLRRSRYRWAAKVSTKKGVGPGLYDKGYLCRLEQASGNRAQNILLADVYVVLGN